MLFCLFVAILATFIWLNITITESNNAKINPYNQDNGEQDKKNAKIKTYLAIIIALFWAIVIRYLN